MARSDTLRSEIAKLEGKGAALTKDLARHRDVENKASALAVRKRQESDRARSDSSRRSADSAAERESKKATTALKKIADIEKKLADNSKAIAGKQKLLSTVVASEQQSLERNASRQHTKAKAQARELARLGRTTHEVRYVHVPVPVPEVLRVLYVTSNPASVETTSIDPDGVVTATTQEWLRVDYEVRQVKAMLKSSKFRDLVVVEHLPAATTMDLLDGLNDHRPHVVHYSGHADEQGLWMENDDGTTDGDDLTFELLTQLLGGTDTPPVLLVLNACEGLAGADMLLQTVPTVIAMAESVTDTGAIAFAARFYAAIASAQSVHSAMEQARVALKSVSLDSDSAILEVRSRDDVDLQKLILVRPFE